MDLSQLDPELAALLNDIPEAPVSLNQDILLSEQPEAMGDAVRDPSEVDLTESEFPKVHKKKRDTPHTLFDSAAFYKAVLANGGDSAQSLHTALTKYLTTKDPKDKAVYRQRVLTSYWDFFRSLVPKIASGTAEIEKRYAIRFGLLLPTLLTPVQKDFFSSVIDENTLRQPVYYLDEWFMAVSEGKINPSVTDEVKPKKKDDNSKIKQMLDKAEGKLQSAENLLRAKSEERLRAEDTITTGINKMFTHESMAGVQNVRVPFTEVQRRTLSTTLENLRKLQQLDKELTGFKNEYQRTQNEVRSLQERSRLNASDDHDVSAAQNEGDTIRQMAKMTCGRQGNHFPILTREYFRSAFLGMGIRENVVEILHWIESIDTEAYCRHYRTQLNRIPPFVILVPTYGDHGFCWEPFDRYNRSTSRGRIVIPMYAKSLKIALLEATADLRWQVAKEKASYYWMEEGLTGNYYQWFQTQDLKGDVKEYFIEDYLLWMTKESEGIQKLNKEVRGVFWRHMPFRQDVKDKLRTRAPAYQDLYQRDLNRQRSDGY